MAMTGSTTGVENLMVFVPVPAPPCRVMMSRNGGGLEMLPPENVDAGAQLTPPEVLFVFELERTWPRYETPTEPVLPVAVPFVVPAVKLVQSVHAITSAHASPSSIITVPRKTSVTRIRLDIGVTSRWSSGSF